MAQFRVEFVLDQSTGKYIAEMYHPENEKELLIRTEALYPTQAAAVLGVVQLFKNAILKFPEPGERPRTLQARKRRSTDKVKKKAAKKPARKVARKANVKKAKKAKKKK